MIKIILPFLFLGFGNVCFSQFTGSVSGKITDGQTNEPLAGATVSIKGVLSSTISNNNGDFVFQKLNTSKIILTISYVGYETTQVQVMIRDGKTTVANVALNAYEQMGNTVVVAASKRPEKVVNAPASIQVIGIKALGQFAGSNVMELMSTIQGIEYTRSGVDEININARGFNSAFNIKVSQLVDGRNTIAALSGSLPLFSNGSTNKDDIERIEVLLGPQSALYGPNAHNALVNFITKDPRKYSGTTVSISAGSQYQFSSRFRHAAKINNKWAYKLTGEYATGEDYTWYDTVYAGGDAGPVPNGFGLPVAIPEKNVNFNFRRVRAEGHIYYSLTPEADVIVSAGGSSFNRLQVTTSGRNQLRDVIYSFLQARYVHSRFFVNIYNTWGNLGNTFIIGSYTRDFWNRTHSTITSGPLYANFGRLSPDSAELFAMRPGNVTKEKGQRLNAETQYNYLFKKIGLQAVAGVSYQKDKPNGYGINLVDNEKRIYVTQYGAVIQLEKSLPVSLRLITAARFDRHSNFGNFFSPKIGVTKQIGNGSARITWGRAYSMPSILNQYAGIGRFLFGNATGITYIPNLAKFSDPKAIKITAPLVPEQVSTWEFGYKANIIKKLFIDINYYNGLNKNFISPTQTVGGRALLVNGFPVDHNPAFAGTVVNDTLKGASFFTFFNYGNVRNYGIDAGLLYSFNKIVSLAIKYSWVGSDITKDNMSNDANKDNYLSPEERSLNAPKNRGAAILSFQNLLKEKLFINISARYVEQYDFYSASQVGTADGKGSRGSIERPGQAPLLKNFDWGPLGGFTTVDLDAGYKLNKTVSLNIGVANLFDTRQIEFVGSPSIGRLIMVEVKVDIPNSKM